MQWQLQKRHAEDAGFDITKEDPFRAGVIIGSGIGSLQEVEKEYDKIKTRGPGRVNPLMVPLMISNMAAGNVSIQLGFRGKCTNVVTACASGTNCIGDAFRAIQYGDADVMVAGGTESCICPDRSSWIYKSDSIVYINRSDARIHSV